MTARSSPVSPPCAWGGSIKCCSRATPELSRMRNLLRRAHATPSLVPPGDIAVLQNMPLKVLNLSGNGMWMRFTGMWGRSVNVLPQGIARAFPGTFLKMTNPSPLPQRSAGDIAALQNMALTFLSLQRCENLTGTLPPAYTELRGVKLCCLRASPERFQELSSK